MAYLAVRGSLDVLPTMNQPGAPKMWVVVIWWNVVREKSMISEHLCWSFSSEYFGGKRLAGFKGGHLAKEISGWRRVEWRVCRQKLKIVLTAL